MNRSLNRQTAAASTAADLHTLSARMTANGTAAAAEEQTVPPAAKKGRKGPGIEPASPRSPLPSGDHSVMSQGNPDFASMSGMEALPSQTVRAASFL